ncbi:MAG: hypothetical protein E5Y51_25160 [Mesorhizobium sp.]|nr:MAG: hypothetical protein E5Y51_25160 [Mesorhizobium sp.]
MDQLEKEAGQEGQHHQPGDDRIPDSQVDGLHQQPAHFPRPLRVERVINHFDHCADVPGRSVDRQMRSETPGLAQSVGEFDDRRVRPVARLVDADHLAGGKGAASPEHDVAIGLYGDDARKKTPHRKHHI